MVEAKEEPEEREGPSGPERRVLRRVEASAPRPGALLVVDGPFTETKEAMAVWASRRRPPV